MNKDVIYIDVDDDVTAIIGKIKKAKEKIVAIVPPKRAGTLRQGGPGQHRPAARCRDDGAARPGCAGQDRSAAEPRDHRPDRQGRRAGQDPGDAERPASG